MAIIRLFFVIDEDDSDILEWWAAQANKSESVRNLIRGDIAQSVGKPTLDDVLAAVAELRTAITAGAVQYTAVGHVSDVEEPADIAAAIDALGVG